MWLIVLVLIEVLLIIGRKWLFVKFLGVLMVVFSCSMDFGVNIMSGCCGWV